ncbi:MAG TPA: hypothetical protein VFN30_02460 [Chitinophagaceae bacterium]|nr:hypothetical protein [Chitinophagaceae bacterium]
MRYKWEIIKTWSVYVVAGFSWSILTSFLAFWYITGSNFSKIVGSMIKKLFQ